MFIEIGVNELNTLYRSTGLTKDQVYRVINNGNLEPNALTVKFGDFVKWNGSKWVFSNTKLATLADANASALAVVNNWIKGSDSTTGTYSTDEVYVAGDVIILNGKLCEITSNGTWDAVAQEYTYTYKTTSISTVLAQLCGGQTLLDLGTKTDDDLDNGTYTVIRANSHTTFALTTATAMTVNANPGLGNFEMLIDNSGNASDLTITVKSNNGQTTYMHSSAAGTDVAAGKIAQLTCVGTCWTLAEFEA